MGDDMEDDMEDNMEDDIEDVEDMEDMGDMDNMDDMDMDREDMEDMDNMDMDMEDIEDILSEVDSTFGADYSGPQAGEHSKHHHTTTELHLGYYQQQRDCLQGKVKCMCCSLEIFFHTGDV